MRTPPLEAVRVICLAEQYPGPYATLLLADLGAEVIIVERPEGGDPARAFPAFHAALNRNKRSVSLDLKNADGKAALCSLIKTADVFMEGFRPGTISRLGFGPDDVIEINSRIVYVSISGFGQTGPNRDRPAHDLSYQAVSGLLFRMARSGVTGAPNDVAVGDLSAGLFAAFGIVTALFDRERTGRGTTIDVSMTDGLVSLMSVFLGAALNNDEITDIGAEPGYGIFSCSDGKLLTLSIAHEDWFWRELCQLLGIVDFQNLRHDERIDHATSLEHRIAEAIASQPRAYWAQQFDKARIPWGPLNDLKDVINDAHFSQRHLFVRAETDRYSGMRYVAQPLLFDGFRHALRRGVPALGEANEEVLVRSGTSMRDNLRANNSPKAVP